MPRMQQCPTCGSKLKKENYQKRIARLRLSRDKITLSLIDDTFQAVSVHFPMDDLDKFSFFKNIEDVLDIVIRKSIRQYLQEKFHERGLGIKYLAGMIKNENTAYGLKEEYERKSLDRIPPKVDK